MDGREHQHIAVIDLLRFICATVVLAYHFWMVFPLAASSATHMFGTSAQLPAGAASWTASGWIGVEIFFVISGYVIAMSAEHADRAAFAKGRVLRLLPTGLICALLSALVLALSGALPIVETAKRLVATVTMLPFGPRIDGAWWTLQVETSFYIAVACFLRKDRRNGARLQLLGICLTVSSLFYYVDAAARGHIPDRIAAPEMLILMPHGMLFALGIALRAIETQGWSFGRFLAGAVALAVSLVEVVLRGSANDGAGGITQPAGIPAAIFLAAILMIALARRWRMSARSARILREVGALTYPLYLLNQVIGAATVVGLLAIGCSPSAALILAAFSTLALAALVSRIIEPPVRRGLMALIDLSQEPQREIRPNAATPCQRSRELMPGAGGP